MNTSRTDQTLIDALACARRAGVITREDEDAVRARGLAPEVPSNLDDDLETRLARSWPEGVHGSNMNRARARLIAHAHAHVRLCNIAAALTKAVREIGPHAMTMNAEAVHVVETIKAVLWSVQPAPESERPSRRRGHDECEKHAGEITFAIMQLIRHGSTNGKLVQTLTAALQHAWEG